MKPEQRLFPRKIIRTHGSFSAQGIAPVRIQTLDLALDGMSVGVPIQLTAGQRCWVNFEIFLNGRKHNVAVAAKVIHSICGGSEGFKAGLQFIDIDEESATAIAEFLKR